MLTLALLTEGDTPALKAALQSLAGLATPDRPLLLIDPGAQDGNRDMLRMFTNRHGGNLLPLGASLTRAEASALARKETGADYALVLTCNDRVNDASLTALERSLDLHRPDLAVMASGGWITHPDRPLPGPDARRAAALPAKPDARDLLTLHPDSRRLLIREGECAAPDPLADPRAAWDIWEKTIKKAEQTLFHPDPVLLTAPSRCGAAASLDAIAPMLAAAPKADRADRLARALHWVGDALALAPPETATDTLTATARLLRALPRSLRAQACAAPAPAGPFLNSVRNGRDGAAHLALLASARTDLHMRALADEYTALRTDLNAALPGPEYLRALHTRLWTR